MSPRQLTRLALALAVVLVAWGVLALIRRPVNDRVVTLALPAVDTARVDTVAITQGGDTALLARGADHRWRVNGQPAAPTNVAQLLAALADTSNHTAMVAENASAQASLGVSADSGRRVRVVEGGRAVLDWTTGHQTGDYTGMYVRPTAGDAVYALHGTLAGAFGHALDAWRDKTIVALAAPGVQRMEVTRGGHMYSLIHGPAGWTLGAGGAVDSAAAARMVQQLNPLSGQAVATAAQAAAANFGRPTARLRVFGPAGAPLADVLFDSTKTGIWARADTGQTVFQVGPWVLNNVAPTERALRKGTPQVR
jgi:hypothetical protein